MKRSDMIKLMIEASLNGPPVREFENYFDNILTQMEKAGMLPPYGAKIEEVNIEDRWGQDTGIVRYVRVIKPLWESEND